MTFCLSLLRSISFTGPNEQTELNKSISDRTVTWKLRNVGNSGSSPPNHHLLTWCRHIIGRKQKGWKNVRKLRAKNRGRGRS